jgi:hypothetical protein
MEKKYRRSEIERAFRLFHGPARHATGAKLIFEFQQIVYIALK